MYVYYLLVCLVLGSFFVLDDEGCLLRGNLNTRQMKLEFKTRKSNI